MFECDPLHPSSQDILGDSDQPPSVKESCPKQSDSLHLAQEEELHREGQESHAGEHTHAQVRPP